MPKNISKNSNDRQNVIEEIHHLSYKIDGVQTVLRKEMRQIGTGIESRLKKEIIELGVKIESVEHKVDLLAENQTGMKKKLDATFETVGQLSEDMVIVKDSLVLRRAVGLERKTR